MPITPEAQAREEIDRLLMAAGWHICGTKDANIHASLGVAIREFELARGFGTADYLLYVNGKAAGVIEAKKVGATLTGVEIQSDRYAKGLSAALPAWRRPLPFLYESTGVETHFTNGLDLDAKARNVFALHRPLEEWLAPLSLGRGAGGEGSRLTNVPPIEYNPAVPIETFDTIVTDEAHRSIYDLWRQVLEYFDAHLIGLTATPNKQTFDFFNQNLVMDYGHPQAVTDAVKVYYDVFRIKTEVTEAGSKVVAGYWLTVPDKPTRAQQDWQLDNDFEYAPAELDRSVQTPDQIRTIARTLGDNWKSDLFPRGRICPRCSSSPRTTTTPRALRKSYGKSTAAEIEYAHDNTYRTTGSKPVDLTTAYRASTSRKPFSS